MSDLMVRDYLQTQGLKLQQEDVRLAQMAAQAVMSAGSAAVERDVLWYSDEKVELATHLEENEANGACLKQVFMALDSAFERFPLQSAAVYLLMQGESPYLLRLAQQGVVIEPILPVGEEAGSLYLAARSAQTGWLNQADDIAAWLASGDLGGAHNERSLSQMSLPVCLPNGRVLGVLHVEAAERSAFDARMQAGWVGLALALAEPLRRLLGAETDSEEDNG